MLGFLFCFLNMFNVSLTALFQEHLLFITKCIYITYKIYGLTLSEEQVWMTENYSTLFFPESRLKSFI